MYGNRESVYQTRDRTWTPQTETERSLADHPLTTGVYAAKRSPHGDLPSAPYTFTRARTEEPVRTGNELLQAAKEYAVEDRKRSWFHFIETWVALLATLAGTIWNIHWSLQIVCSILAGLVGVRMFILYHDFQHGAFLRKSKVAEGIMWVFGIFSLNPASVWTRSHNYHHKHNAKIYGSSIGSYPVMTTDDWAKADDETRRAYAWSRSPMAIALGYWTMFLDGMVLRSIKTNKKRHWDSILALVVHAVLVVTLAIWAPVALVLTLLFPMMLLHAVGAYLFYVQHNYPGVQLKGRREWDYVHAALNCSSYFKMSKVMHWFTGNIGYHHVHHLNPRIPFYALPDVMEAMPELQTPGVTTWKLSHVLECFSLKLWDFEQNRFVGFDAAPTGAGTPAAPSATA